MTGGPHPFRATGPAAASLAVNALLIGTLLGLGVREAPRRDEGPSLTMLSLAALKGVEQGAEQSEASERAEAETDAPVSARTPPPMPASPPQPVPPPLVTAPSALPVSAAPAAPAPAAATAPAQAPASPHAAAMAAPAAGAPPARRGIADGLDANAPSGTSRAYAARVRSWLYAHKIYPRRAKMRHEEGVVRVRFVIDRAGILIEGRIVGSSGRAALDEEAMAMLQRASPYPKAPGDVPGDRIEFTAPVEFVLPV